ncbi:putative membrane protein [Pseudomonas syringae pv. cerasicola]|nr:putative membrane protein [Pseudomonas syringae pv. cerasicola]SPF16516.1 putative membrane protein [Pseudomonas syringae pv. cerasicola]
MIVIPRSIALRASLNLIIALPSVAALRMYEG